MTVNIMQIQGHKTQTELKYLILVNSVFRPSWSNIVTYIITILNHDSDYRYV